MVQSISAIPLGEAIMRASTASVRREARERHEQALLIKAEIMKTRTSLARTPCLRPLSTRLRTACAMWLLPLLLLMPPAALQAQFNFTTNNGTITVTGYTGSGGAVTIPDTTNGYPVTSIGPQAFANGHLTSVLIGTNVTSIGQAAFQECSGLASVTIPNSVTSIGGFAFVFCGSLTGITIPDSVTSIGDSAFRDCTSLTSVTIPNSVTNIGVLVFGGCTKLKDVTIASGFTSIGPEAFYGCSSLASVTIPNSVTSIGRYAFAFCGSLTSATVPNSVTNIGEYAFSDCHGLTSVTMGANVTSIGSGAFYNCTILTSVTIPNSVTHIGVGVFGGCISLTGITVEALNDAYISVNGVLFNKSQTTLIQYPGGKAGNYTIPNSVTSIGDSAFNLCTNATSVTIPDSVTNIGSLAFSFSGLISVTIPSSVTSIGNQAFQGCTRLTGVYFSGNAPSIGSDVFDGDNIATVYHLPGTTGWAYFLINTGISLVLWNPQPQTVGVHNNEFGFNITGITNIPIVVEASTNLASASWTALQTCTLTNGLIHFSDPLWTNYPARFYRLRSP
jgi:hypothetical protein